MIEFVGLRAKTYSYLIDDGSQDKIAKCTNKCVIKRKLKFENFKNCSEGTQHENKIIILEKIKLTQIVLKKVIKNSSKNNKLILKTQKRFKIHSKA